MTPVSAFTFNNGQKVPAVGIGCWMGAPGKGERVEAMVLTALKHGYRHIDTAMFYDNEEAIGNAIRASGIPREEIFVATKFVRQANANARSALESSLASLRLDYIDLWLMHSPIGQKDGQFMTPDDSPTYVDAWKEMERAYEEGKVKSIGVSNFSIKTLEVLLKDVEIVPVTNQVEIHPAYPQNDLLEYCKQKDILLTAYSPLGQYKSPFFKDPILQDVAAKERGTVAQVILSWGVQRGTIVIPKSENEERMKENIQILILSDDSMRTINNWHKQPKMHKPVAEYFSYDPGRLFGWTYEQMGWNLRWDDEEKAAFAL